MIFTISQVEKIYLIILEMFWENGIRKGTLVMPWFLCITIIKTSKTHKKNDKVQYGIEIKRWIL